ncbi:MAG: (d)CMP kinase [Pseudomonadota bacterium]|nr:(d)CMP kinase [Pseudomonadota bacterium]
MNVPVVTLDGPAGAGKGTIAAALAKALGWHYLESGVLYRAVALLALRQGVAADDVGQLVTIARDMDVDFFLPDSGPACTRINGEFVAEALRHESCAGRASQIAALPALRDALLAVQRGFRRAPGLVADGRDMGTVVFPDAEVKIYLTASPWERAERRHKQLITKGGDGSLRALFSELIERDRRDRERAVAPLRPASDAVVVDTTGVPIEGVLARVTEILRQRLPASSTGPGVA